MINLIPPEGHKTLRNEYILRVGTIYSFLLSGVLLSATVLLVPTKVLLDTELSIMVSRTGSEKNDTTQYVDSDRTIRDANVLIAQLSIPLDVVPISVIIGEIQRASVAGISFTSFQATRDVEDLSTLTVQGVATSRGTLAAFKDALEREPHILSADVPISDLARETDLPFVIKVMLKK